MDEIKVGDRRRFATSDHEHEVTAVAHFAVKVRHNDHRTELIERPDYDIWSDPVPAAPTFERGDVVHTPSGLHATVTHGGVGGGDSKIRVTDEAGRDLIEFARNWTPTGHKVATVDEGRWAVIWADRVFTYAHNRESAEDAVRGSHSAIAIATIRDGRVVTPVTHEGVEHLVPVLSEARS